jgi:hypothetical protein
MVTGVGAGAVGGVTSALTDIAVSITMLYMERTSEPGREGEKILCAESSGPVSG